LDNLRKSKRSTSRKLLNALRAWSGAMRPTGPGRYEIRWPEVGGPLYPGGAPPFDPTKIEAIGFHVVSRETEAAPHAFRIRNVALLTN
jgi:hypothetical protein